jgi:hypothetical protein
MKVRIGPPHAHQDAPCTDACYGEMLCMGGVPSHADLGAGNILRHDEDHSVCGHVGSEYREAVEALTDLSFSHATVTIAYDTARKLLEYAYHLRVHGERAPGGTETWAEFDRRVEAFLRAHPPITPQAKK